MIKTKVVFWKADFYNQSEQIV